MPRWKVKSAYLRETIPAAQLKALYHQLTQHRLRQPVRHGCPRLLRWPDQQRGQRGDGGRATRLGLKLLYVTLWTDATQDARHERWIRECYADIYVATGGVPSPTNTTDGCFINYADADLADPALNTSGVAWHELYFKDNYPRLQQVKFCWDPLKIFSHALSIRSAAHTCADTGPGR